jgi:sulfur-oxidizing protein SoxA
LKHGALFLGIAALAAVAAAGEIPLAERRSGYEFMGRETRAMQDDDATNPGTLWLLDGEALWSRKTGERSCADCHGDASSSMKGVATRYPAVDAKGRLLNLEQRINECRVERQKAPALAFESRDLLALTAYVARQSRGLPIEIKVDEKTKWPLEAGRERFYRRQAS